MRVLTFFSALRLTASESRSFFYIYCTFPFPQKLRPRSSRTPTPLSHFNSPFVYLYLLYSFPITGTSETEYYTKLGQAISSSTHLRLAEEGTTIASIKSSFPLPFFYPLTYLFSLGNLTAVRVISADLSHVCLFSVGLFSPYFSQTHFSA